MTASKRIILLVAALALVCGSGEQRRSTQGPILFYENFEVTGGSNCASEENPPTSYDGAPDCDDEQSTEMSGLQSFESTGASGTPDETDALYWDDRIVNAPEVFWVFAKLRITTFPGFLADHFKLIDLRDSSGATGAYIGNYEGFGAAPHEFVAVAGSSGSYGLCEDESTACLNDGNCTGGESCLRTAEHDATFCASGTDLGKLCDDNSECSGSDCTNDLSDQDAWVYAKIDNSGTNTEISLYVNGVMIPDSAGGTDYTVIRSGNLAPVTGLGTGDSGYDDGVFIIDRIGASRVDPNDVSKYGLPHYPSLSDSTLWSAKFEEDATGSSTNGCTESGAENSVDTDSLDCDCDPSAGTCLGESWNNDTEMGAVMACYATTYDSCDFDFASSASLAEFWYSMCVYPDVDAASGSGEEWFQFRLSNDSNSEYELRVIGASNELRIKAGGIASEDTASNIYTDDEWFGVLGHIDSDADDLHEIWVRDEADKSHRETNPASPDASEDSGDAQTLDYASVDIAGGTHTNDKFLIDNIAIYDSDPGFVPPCVLEDY